MRKQYHPLTTERGLLLCDVDRLVGLAENPPPRTVPLTSTTFPILLRSDGRVMDGMHRVLEVALEGGSEIRARRFDVDPEPDHVDVRPRRTAVLTVP